MFGEDAGLQRLGRGKGNVWSYQNSKESTGAMRDASGQLLKAPNLSNYRKKEHMGYPHVFLICALLT
eukprot:scaffold165841_cov21-Tisochrysis_lutea.AAC.5